MMKTVKPKISICIPAFNRPTDLVLLLESIRSQNYKNYEIVVSEDNSPQSTEIQRVCEDFSVTHPQIPIYFFRNKKTLGYDENLRSLLHKAHGEYCLFMGDDDLMYEGALARLGMVIEKHPDIGVILRSSIAIDRNSGRIINTFRYFNSDRFFPAGVETIITFFRRSVFISGMTFHRMESIKYDTDRFDGTLLYQLYLAGNILMTMNGYYINDYISVGRSSGTHYFGTAEKEKSRFTPELRLPEHSLNFMKGMFDIAMAIERDRKVPVFGGIVKDIGNYSYPILSIQARRSNKSFAKYAFKLARFGLWKNMLFWLYFAALLLFGPGPCDKLILIIKKTIGHTPLIGRVYNGKDLHSGPFSAA